MQSVDKLSALILTWEINSKLIQQLIQILRDMMVFLMVHFLFIKIKVVMDQVVILHTTKLIKKTTVGMTQINFQMKK